MFLAYKTQNSWFSTQYNWECCFLKQNFFPYKNWLPSYMNVQESAFCNQKNPQQFWLRFCLFRRKIDRPKSRCRTCEYDLFLKLKCLSSKTTPWIRSLKNSIDKFLLWNFFEKFCFGFGAWIFGLSETAIFKAFCLFPRVPKSLRPKAAGWITSSKV